MPDASLLELLKEVRGKTLKLLEGVDDAQARFAPPGLQNTILWHAGHALVVNEHLCCEAAGQKPTYPAGYFEKFSWKSNPAEVRDWPTIAEVVALLTEQRTRMHTLIESLDAARLEQVIGAAPRNRTLGGTILHGLHDEAGHQGEIHLLKKLWKLKQPG